MSAAPLATLARFGQRAVSVGRATSRRGDAARARATATTSAMGSTPNPPRGDHGHGRHADGAQSRLRRDVPSGGLQDQGHPDRDRGLARGGARARERHHPRDGDRGSGDDAAHARRRETRRVPRRQGGASRSRHPQRPSLRRALPRQRLAAPFPSPQRWRASSNPTSPLRTPSCTSARIGACTPPRCA